MALILWGITITPMVAFHFLVSEPGRERLDAVRGEVEQKERIYSSITKAKSPASQKRIRDELAALKKKRDAFLVDFNAVSKLDLSFAAMAGENGLQEFSSKALYGGKNPALAKLKHIGERNFKVWFTADFPSFLKFVNQLERSHPAVFVDQFTITRSMTNASPPDAELEVAVLFEKEE
jgi:hypothetical protein